jgi:hypothetical protein
MIEYEKLRRGVVWERLSQLLNDPSARGMPRDMEVQDAAPIMADDKEAVLMRRAASTGMPPRRLCRLRASDFPISSVWRGIPRSSDELRSA